MAHIAPAPGAHRPRDRPGLGAVLVVVHRAASPRTHGIDNDLWRFYRLTR